MTNIAQEMKILADETMALRKKEREALIKEEVDQILTEIKVAAKEGKYSVYYHEEYNAYIFQSLRDKGFTTNTLNKGATGYSWSVSWK